MNPSRSDNISLGSASGCNHGSFPCACLAVPLSLDSFCVLFPTEPSASVATSRAISSLCPPLLFPVLAGTRANNRHNKSEQWIQKKYKGHAVYESRGIPPHARESAGLWAALYVPQAIVMVTENVLCSTISKIPLLLIPMSCSDQSSELVSSLTLSARITRGQREIPPASVLRTPGMNVFCSVGPAPLLFQDARAFS